MGGFFLRHLPYWFPSGFHSNPHSPQCDVPSSELPTLGPPSWLRTLHLWLEITLSPFELLASCLSVSGSNPQLRSPHLPSWPRSPGSAPTPISPPLSPFKEEITSSFPHTKYFTCTSTIKRNAFYNVLNIVICAVS